MLVQGGYANMSDNKVCVIGGYDLLAKAFYSELKKKENLSIFINVDHTKYVNRRGVFNFKIFELKKILQTLKENKISKLVFLGKINRPNLSDFKNDGIVENYLPLLVESFKKGDGNILSTVIKIFAQNGFSVLSPKKISKNFFLSKAEIGSSINKNDKIDINKSIKILNALSKYDNAQSIIIVDGYIIAIEAAEGTDNLIKRTVNIRKYLNQLNKKSGFLTKIPKKNQSKLIDLPVIGPKTIKLILKANLRGIAINTKLTMIYKKTEFLKIINENDLRIYDLS